MRAPCPARAQHGPRHAGRERDESPSARQVDGHEPGASGILERRQQQRRAASRLEPRPERRGSAPARAGRARGDSRRGFASGRADCDGTGRDREAWPAMTNACAEAWCGVHEQRIVAALPPAVDVAGTGRAASRSRRRWPRPPGTPSATAARPTRESRPSGSASARCNASAAANGAAPPATLRSERRGVTERRQILAEPHRRQRQQQHRDRPARRHERRNDESRTGAEADDPRNRRGRAVGQRHFARRDREDREPRDGDHRERGRGGHRSGSVSAHHRDAILSRAATVARQAAPEDNPAVTEAGR